MSGANIEKKVLGLLSAFEGAGRSVSRVTVDGRKIELVLSGGKVEDDYDRIDMRHDKT
jgi:hypothetical protein